MIAEWEMMEHKQDGKPQQSFRLVNGPLSSADLSKGLRALAASLEKSGRTVEGAVLQVTLEK